MVLLVSYDLDHHARPSQYAAVEKMLKENSTSWAKPLYSQWFIETNESADTWSNRMKTITDSNDYWLIVQLSDRIKVG